MSETLIKKSELKHPQFGVNLDVHSALDYLFVVTALSSPYLLGFSKVPLARKSIQTIFGVSAVKDLMTKYRFSLAKKIPIGSHLVMDLLVGSSTLIAPFLFGFWKDLKPSQRAFFVALGLGVFPFVAFTHPKTEGGKVREREAGSNVKSLIC